MPDTGKRWQQQTWKGPEVERDILELKPSGPCLSEIHHQFLALWWTALLNSVPPAVPLNCPLAEYVYECSKNCSAISNEYDTTKVKIRTQLCMQYNHIYAYVYMYFITAYFCFTLKTFSMLLFFFFWIRMFCFLTLSLAITAKSVDVQVSHGKWHGACIEPTHILFHTLNHF